jgi:hypothetical protein
MKTVTTEKATPTENKESVKETIIRGSASSPEATTPPPDEKRPSTIATKLTESEVEDRDRIVDDIQANFVNCSNGQKSQLVLGRPLREARKKKIHRDTHDDFFDWVFDNFGVHKSQAYNYMNAADVRFEEEFSTLVENGTFPEPTSPYQLAPLTNPKIDNKDRVRAYTRAVENNEGSGKPISNEDIKEAIKQLRLLPKKPPVPWAGPITEDALDELLPSVPDDEKKELRRKGLRLAKSVNSGFGNDQGAEEKAYLIAILKNALDALNATGGEDDDKDSKAA